MLWVLSTNPLGVGMQPLLVGDVVAGVVVQTLWWCGGREGGKGERERRREGRKEGGREGEGGKSLIS